LSSNSGGHPFKNKLKFLKKEKIMKHKKKQKLETLTLGRIEDLITDLKISHNEITSSTNYNLFKLRNKLSFFLTDENYSISRDMDTLFLRLYKILNYETIQKYSATDINTYDDYDFLESDSCCIFCYIGFDKTHFYRDHNIN
jgi:hypothetical protein